MKRVLHLHNNGVLEKIATIAVETEAVVVSIRNEGSRSKGKPTRIPVALIEDGNLENEAFRQASMLEMKGYVAQSSTDWEGNQAAFYLAVRQQEGDKANACFDALVKAQDQLKRIKGLNITPLSSSCIYVSDGRNKMSIGPGQPNESKVIHRDTPMMAVALLLAQRDAAKLIVDTAEGGVELQTVAQIRSVAASLPDATIREVMEELGVIAFRGPTVAPSARAVLL